MVLFVLVHVCFVFLLKKCKRGVLFVLVCSFFSKRANRKSEQSEH